MCGRDESGVTGPGRKEEKRRRSKGCKTRGLMERQGAVRGEQDIGVEGEAGREGEAGCGGKDTNIYKSVHVSPCNVSLTSMFMSFKSTK